MSTIINTIQDICADQLGLPFLYESVSMANVKLDRQKDFPVAILMTVTDWVVDNSIGNMKEVANIRLFFLNRTSDRPTIDYDAAATQELVDICKNYAVNFINEVNLSKTVTFVSNQINLTTIVDYDDANVCGVMLQGQLKELKGECLPIIP